MKTKIYYLILGIGLIFTMACTKYPPSSDRLLEDLVVITQYDTKIDFNEYHTYSLPGAIMKITDKDTIELSGQEADAIIANIDKNMQARGFLKIVAGKPDFGIQVLYFENTTVYTYYYDWWGGYYYPYYPYYPVYYGSYTTGMANIELIDLKTVTPDQRVNIRWNAFIRGLLTGYHTTAEINSRIDQAFIQTPQLVTTAN